MILDRFGIADVFGVSPDAVRNWLREGCPSCQEPKTGKGVPAEERKRLYDPASVHNWLLRRAAQAQRWR